MEWETRYEGCGVTVTVTGNQHVKFTTHYAVSNLGPEGPLRFVLSEALPHRFDTEADALASAYEAAIRAIDRGLASSR